MQDDDIVALLRKMPRPTFATRDRDYFSRTLASEDYCLAYLDVRPLDVAEYIRRLLRHPAFKSWNQRKGCVTRVSASGISVWRAHAARLRRTLGFIEGI